MVPADLLADRARRAYERGRLRRAVLGAWPAVGLAGACALAGAPPVRVLPLALWLAGLTIVLLHRGRGLGRAVPAGLLAGAVPMLAGLMACRLPHACRGPGCVSLCLPLCAGTGLLAGLLLTRRALRQGRDHVSLLAAAAVAASTAGLGCLALGAGASMGVLIGLALGTLPAWAPARR